jgi:hypothetical protein
VEIEIYGNEGKGIVVVSSWWTEWRGMDRMDLMDLMDGMDEMDLIDG